MVHTPIFDCLTYLQFVTSYGAEHRANNGLLSACVQAEATRHAAKLGARATTNAGLMTLGAGLLAVVAAGIAVSPELGKQKRASIAKSLEVLGEISNLLWQLEASAAPLRARQNKQSYWDDGTVAVFSLSPSLADQSWLSSASLSSRSIRALSRSKAAYISLREFVCFSNDEIDRPDQTGVVTCDIGNNTDRLLGKFQLAIDALESCEQSLMKEGAAWWLPWSVPKEFRQTLRTRRRLARKK